MSNPGKGSSFILYLPLTYAPPRTSRRSAPPGLIEIEGPGGGPEHRPFKMDAVQLEHAQEPTLLSNEAQDDRDVIQPGDTVLLIVENDIAFARFLLEAVREHGCKGLVTSQGAAL